MFKSCLIYDMMLLPIGQVFMDKSQGILRDSTCGWTRFGHKRGNRFRSSLQECYEIADFILLEVTLQHALQSNAVAGLVAGHLSKLGIHGSQEKCLRD